MTHAASPLMPTRTLETLAEVTAHLPRTTSAILFHTSNEGLAMVTAHGVEEDGAGLPHIGPGRPLTPSDEMRLVDLLVGGGDTAVRILPPSLLAMTSSMLIWWMPPVVRPMLIKPRDGRAPIEVTTRWPSLVVLVHGRTLFIAAVKGDQRPTGTSELFHAPVANVFSDGRVCTGSARLPHDCNLDTMAGWEHVLVGSNWTHSNHDETMVWPKSKRKRAGGTTAETKDNYRTNDFWELRDGCDEPFPDDRLVPLGMTLSDWPIVLQGLTPTTARRGRR